MHVWIRDTTAVEAEEALGVRAVGLRIKTTMAAGTSSTLDVLRIPMEKGRMVANGSEQWHRPSTATL